MGIYIHVANRHVKVAVAPVPKGKGEDGDEQFRHTR